MEILLKSSSFSIVQLPMNKLNYKKRNTICRTTFIDPINISSSHLFFFFLFCSRGPLDGLLSKTTDHFGF